MSCYAQAPRPVSPYPRTCAPRNPIRRASYARRRAHVVRTRGVCAKPRRHAGAVRSGARCTRPVHRRHAAQALHQPVSPYPRTCAPRNPIRRAPYARAHPHSSHTRRWPAGASNTSPLRCTCTRSRTPTPLAQRGCLQGRYSHTRLVVDVAHLLAALRVGLC